MPPAEADDGAGSVPPNFFLTPHQQNLLFAALNTNRQTSAATGAFPAPGAVSLSPTSFQSSPLPSLDGGARYQESPYLDKYDYDFGDSSFDFSLATVDQSQTANDGPATVKSDSTEADSNEKRHHPDDEEPGDSPGNDSKRHEASEKAPKKPGRKPLTSEPTSKRKAQNRAAQRAFRERKEKHLKDLETKVHELEKASEAANHENSKLRTQLNGITTELNHYKQRLAVLTNTTKAVPRDGMPLSNPLLGNLADLNFPFEFPKFGSPLVADKSATQNGQAAQRQSFGDKTSPTSVRPSAHDEYGRLSSMTSSRASVDGFGGATSSPSASSNSNAGGPVSSCGTSPEPPNHSPMGSKPLETLTTIGEEQPGAVGTLAGHFPPADNHAASFDWLASQNGGQFDPQLFGDYREPQDNILSGTNIDDFFNDALDADFLTPYNVPPLAAPPGPKRNLIDEIDAEQNALDEDLPKEQNVRCTKIWDRLQGCPKAQSGEFDLDGLCSELTQKAKCSGHGPVVAERDFDSILRKYMGKDVSPHCVASSLGFEVHPDEKPNGVVMP
ncbi:hypothetical protein XA68_12190 [Ophiocordyceps unilateralis]|uniref:BZIP domain-containing protein n=1 Tax=Ophiocordyceps unilateralis TaxID=268505 RepID=A0A2A9PE10_OPHUN|nr:hypothetical protein XA68_12190 [Ophiocordyceps unilateralis]